MTEHERVDPNEVAEALGATPIGEGATTLDFLFHRYPWLKKIHEDYEEQIADMTRAVIAEDRLIKELDELQERYNRQQQELMTAHSDFASLNSRHMALVKKQSDMSDKSHQSGENNHT